MSIENMYSFVTNPKRDLQGIAIKQGKYFGVIYEYDKVTFGKINELVKDIILNGVSNLNE